MNLTLTRFVPSFFSLYKIVPLNFLTIFFRGQNVRLQELLADPVSDGECLIDADAHLDNRHCLAKITGDLVKLVNLLNNDF